MSLESIDVDGTDSKGGGQGQLPPLRTRTSRGSPAQVDPSILNVKDGSTSTTWLRKVPPVIGMRERDSDDPLSASGSMEEPPNSPQRSQSPLDAQGARSRTISANASTRAPGLPQAEKVEGETPAGSPKNASWAPSVRLGTHGHKEARKLTILVPSEDNPSASTDTAKSAPPKPKTVPVQAPIVAPSPSTNSTPTTSQLLPKITPNLSMPLLSTLFEQTHSLLDRKEEDWAIANYDQLRHVISQLFNSVPLIREMLNLVKRIAPIFIERRQEREATNRYKEVMYLAEKIGGDAAAEQIELNLLVADSYILRSELALHDQELAVNIAAYANEALWLCQTYKLTARLEDCKSKIDLAEALFCAIFLVNTNIVLRLTLILNRKPSDFARGFKLVERTLHQLFKHQSWLMIRKLYQAGILQACTQASQKLNDDSYLLQMLYIQTQVNFTFLKPSDPTITSNIADKPTDAKNFNASRLKEGAEARRSTVIGAGATKPSNASLAPSVTLGVPAIGLSSPSLSDASSNSGILESLSGWLPTDVLSNWSEFRHQLEAMRNDVNVQELSQNLLNPDYVAGVQANINTRLVTLVRAVFDYCVEMVGDPPCPFSVFGLGSLSRGEAAPYSDLEYGFIIQDEAKRESNYWKDLWTIFEFTFICFGERVGFHTDDQGSPKTPTFRGTPAQLVELFLQPLDAHDISTAFSMLRPMFIASYRCGRELHDSYISMVNRVLTSSSSIAGSIGNFNASLASSNLSSSTSPSSSSSTIGNSGSSGGSASDSTLHQYTKIGTLFLEDHLSQLSKWTPGENDPCVELKTHFLQPLVFTITDIALTNGSYVSSTTAGVLQLIDGLGDGRNSHLGISPDFARSVKALFLACYGLKVLAQLHYHEQFEGDKVSIAQPLINSSTQGGNGNAVNSTSSSGPSTSASTTSSATPASATSAAGTPTANGGVTNVIGAIYYLSREQVYWLRVAQSVVLKPLYACLPHILAYVQTNPFTSIIPPSGLPAFGGGQNANTSGGSSSHPSTSGSSSYANGSSYAYNGANGGGAGGWDGSNSNATFFSGVPRNWAKIDPIIDASEALVDPRFDPFGSSKPTALEETKDLIRSLVATLIFRDAPISRYRYYYKQLAADFKLLFRAAVTSHAGAQGARVQMLSYVFDSYAAPDGTRPLIERLKAHFRDHIAAIDPSLLQKAFETAKIQNTFNPLASGSGSGISSSFGSAMGLVAQNAPVALIRVSQPVGWPSQSRFKEAPPSTMKPLMVTRFEGQIGYELIISLLHFSMIGYGAPLLDARLMHIDGTKATPALPPTASSALNSSSNSSSSTSPRTVKIGSHNGPSGNSSTSGASKAPPASVLLPKTNASSTPLPSSSSPCPSSPVVPAIFVETPSGDSLYHVLTQDPARIKLLDSKSFTELILVNIVLMCDARAEDYIFEALTDDPRGGHRLSRYTFGQTEPSPEPILIQKEKASLCVSNVLFCLSSMLQTVHPYAVEEFLGLSPTHLMTRLVQDVETINKDWKTKLDPSGVAAFNRLVLPAPLPSTTSVVNIPHFVLGLLFDRIVKLQKILTSAPRSTHLDLLRHIDPIVGQFYADVLSNFAPNGVTGTGGGINNPTMGSVIIASPVPILSSATIASVTAAASNGSSSATQPMASNAIASALMGAQTSIALTSAASLQSLQGSSPSPVGLGGSGGLGGLGGSLQGSSSPFTIQASSISTHFGGLGASSSAAASAAMEIMERLARVEQRREFPVSAVFAVHSTSPKLYSRIERLRRSTHAILPSSLPSTEPVFEKSDHAAQAEELKYLLMTLSPASSGSSIAFPREDMLKNHAMKEKLLCSIDFAKVDLKKQRQTLLALFDSVKFTSQLRIRNCPELDHTRLSRLLTATTPKETSKDHASSHHNSGLTSSDYNINTLKTLAVLDIRGMTGFKLQTLQLIATLENLEYLNMSQTDVKSISVEKWTKREPVQLDKVIWMSCSKCTGLQHLLLRAPNLRHLDIAGDTLLTEFRVWSNQKVALIGQLGGGSGGPSSSPFSAFSTAGSSSVSGISGAGSSPGTIGGVSGITSMDSPSSRNSGGGASLTAFSGALSSGSGSSNSPSPQTTPQKLFQEIPTISWFYSDAIPSSLEKILFDVVCARDARLVYHVALNEASVRVLCEVIKHSLSLEGVDLSASHIGADDLIEALVAATVANPNIKTLDLTNCGLKPSKLPACLQLSQARADLKAKFV